MADVKMIFHDLVRLETELWNAVDARLQAEHDLKLSWFEFMQLMARYQGCRVYDIKEELSITIGGTSKLVDRIEAAGLCRRRANPDDGRSQIIELTPAGRRLLTKAVKTVDDELEDRLTAGLTARALDQFASTLDKLRAANRRSASADEAVPSAS